MTIRAIINRILRPTGYSFSKTIDFKSETLDLQRLNQNYVELPMVKLHFGCGPRVLKHWINIDLFYEPFEKYLKYYTDSHYPLQVRGDRSDFYAINFMKDGIPLPDESVDVIFHEDFFEHLTQKEQVVFLAESLRVMKKGAVHRINTPNLAASMRDNSKFSLGKEGVFIQEWDNWHHYSIMSPKTLEEIATIVGYSTVIFNSKNKSIISHELPIEYRPDEKDRPSPDSNVFADLIK